MTATRHHSCRSLPFSQRALRRSGRKPTRLGVAAVEFAIVVPIFLLMVFGIMELGRAFMVQQIITNASREGARRAILEQATAVEVQTLVNDYLGATSVNSGATVVLNPAALGPGIGLGDPISVTVTVPYSSVSWLPNAWWLGGIQLSASSVMRAERVQ